MKEGVIIGLTLLALVPARCRCQGPGGSYTNRLHPSRCWLFGNQSTTGSKCSFSPAATNAAWWFLDLSPLHSSSTRCSPALRSCRRLRAQSRTPRLSPSHRRPCRKTDNSPFWTPTNRLRTFLICRVSSRFKTLGGRCSRLGRGLTFCSPRVLLVIIDGCLGSWLLWER